jgi:hypothetical protein
VKTSGGIVAVGGVSSGITLYVKDGVPIFDYNYYGEHTVVKAPQALPAGDATVELDFKYAGGGIGKGANLVLTVNGQKVGEGKMKATLFARFGVDTFGVGEDSGQPVTPDYEPPFKFTGTIDKVVIELGPMDLSEAYQATVRKAEHRAYQMTE